MQQELRLCRHLLLLTLLWLALPRLALLLLKDARHIHVMGCAGTTQAAEGTLGAANTGM